MYHYNDVTNEQFMAGDQYVPDMKYVNDIKLESDMDSYYPMNIDLSSMKVANRNQECLRVPPILSLCGSSTSFTNHNNNTFMGNTFETSDGECSPKSLDENELLENMLGNNNSTCVKGIRTITRNPRRTTNKPRNVSGCGKARGRARKSTESIVPKEKDRARLFNEAFDGLRKRIPSIPISKKLSKIEILRLAICYMSYLKFRLHDLPRMDFIEAATLLSTVEPEDGRMQSQELSNSTNLQETGATTSSDSQSIM